MHSRDVYESVDQTLQKFFKSDLPFSGIPVLFGGDWRQTLPILQRANRGQIINACLKSSYLWQAVTIHRLTINMRLLAQADHLLPEEVQERRNHAEYLLDVGNGAGCSGSEGKGELAVPERLQLPEESPEALINHVFGDIAQSSMDPEYFASRAILCARNDDASVINDMVNEKLTGDLKILSSYDKIESANGEDADRLDQRYPPEFVRNIVDWTLPPHQLKVKEGTVVMCLRNMNPKAGLCNGTRMIVNRIRLRVLECRILTGPDAGTYFPITRA